MIKKIQQYLLVHYPLLWNIRLVPMLLACLALNLLFFGIGYISTYVDFSSSFYNDNSPLIYFSIALSILCIFIAWLLQYRKNNAFNTFYPKKRSALYAEWLLTFVILFCLFVTPFTYNQGAKARIKSYASDQETENALKILENIHYLIPEYKNNYFREFPYGYIKDDYGNIVKVVNEEDYYYDNRNNYNDEEIDSIVSRSSYALNLADFPNFTQLSLLNQEFYEYEYNGERSDTSIVKKWLVTQNKKAIEQAMKDFLLLAKQHKLYTNLTAEKWLKLIYNPPTYPISDNNLIVSSAREYQSYLSRKYYDDMSGRDYARTHYFVPYSELYEAYSEIHKAYHQNEETDVLLLVMACVACVLSLIIFSNRCSPGKSFLAAIISLIIIGFISFFLVFIWKTVLYDYSRDLVGIDLYILFWLALFGAELGYVINRIRKNRNKGLSKITIHHLTWYVPFVPFLLFLLIFNHMHEHASHTCEAIHCNICSIHDWIREGYNLAIVIWIILALSFVSMWFYISSILRKWKALPEK